MWCQSLGLTCSTLTLRNYRICSNHFTRNDYDNEIGWKLKSTAVPSKFAVYRIKKVVIDIIPGS